MTEADTTEKFVTENVDGDTAAAQADTEDSTDAVDGAEPRREDLEERLVAEGEIAGDYLEELLWMSRAAARW
jgi:spoIIIJ-associated protein